MTNLSFQGAGGFISYHDVSTTVDAFWVSDYRREILIEVYNPLISSDFKIIIKVSASDLQKIDYPE